jgi:RES domain-containing protein
VDDVEGMTGDLVGPRRLLTCRVKVTKILDLRVTEHRLAVGLRMQDLMSPTDEHEPCWHVGRAAHQLGLHGVIAPAATGLGETLALFEKHLPEAELPIVTGEQTWAHLPSDPRQLRAVERRSEIEP